MQVQGCLFAILSEVSANALFGVGSVAALLFGHLFYIRDIVRGKVKPQRSTWFIFQLLSIVAVVNQVATGNMESSWVFMSAGVTGSIICFLAMLRGVGGVSKLDIAIVVLSVVGIVLWLVKDEQSFTTISTSIVILLAVTPTFEKVYSDPFSENIALWLLSLVATLCIVGSINEITFESALIPATWVVSNTTLTLMVWIGQKSLRTH